MKKPIDNIDDNAKYVIFSNNTVNIDKFKVKPIVIRYHGALIEDLSNNSVVYSKELSKEKITLIKSYACKYKVSFKENKIGNKVYEIELNSLNYYRMLVMPSFIKNEYKGIMTYYTHPFSLDKKNYQNYIIDDDISVLKSILCVINYLNLQSNDILDLVNVCYLMIDSITSQGYCMMNNKLKIKNKGLFIKEGENLI